MQEMKPDPKILEKAEEISHQVAVSAQALNKGQIKWNHEGSLEIITAAMMINLLTEIRDELRFSNHEKRISQFTKSMFSTGQLPKNKGE